MVSMKGRLVLALIGLFVFVAIFAMLAFVIFPSVGNGLTCKYLYGGEVWQTKNPLTGEVHSWCVLPPHGVIR
jgi:hypothetical protein